MEKITPYAKAVAAFVVAGASFAIPVVDDGLTASEWLGIIVAAFAGLGIVYSVPNRDPKALHQSDSVMPPGA